MKYRILLILLPVWFASIFWASWTGLFKNPVGVPPAGIGLAFGLPLMLFLVVSLVASAVRKSFLDFSPVLLASLHGWRFVGLGFIMAYYRGLLPPGFAWPAGLGDIAVAASTPFIVYQLSRDAAWVRGRWFLAWNIFGVIDFLAAVGLGIAHQAVPHWFNASISTELMQELPFVLIPCFFVPLLGMTHGIMLYQIYRAADSIGSRSVGSASIGRGGLART